MRNHVPERRAGATGAEKQKMRATAPRNEQERNLNAPNTPTKKENFFNDEKQEATGWPKLRK